MSGFAWVTLATNDSYSLGALVLAHSLRQVGTAHQLAVLVTPGVTNPMRQKLATVFNVVQEVNILDSKDEINLRLLKRPELGITFTKLHCWRLTQFEKCVFLDADTLVLVNSDELFEREEFSAAPDVGWPDCFNSGVFVYRPSNGTYSKLVEFAVEKGSFDGGDQGLLNLFFSDWAHKDISKHLPFIYNMCSTASYSYLPAFKQFGADVKIVHFIGPAKPWLQYFDTETRKVHPSPGLQHLQDVLQRWWDIFCSLIHPNLTPDMTRSRAPAEHISPHNPPSHTPSTSTYHLPTVNHHTVLSHENYSKQPDNLIVEGQYDFSDVIDPWDEYDHKRHSENHDHTNSHVTEVFSNTSTQVEPQTFHNNEAHVLPVQSNNYFQSPPHSVSQENHTNHQTYEHHHSMHNANIIDISIFKKKAELIIETPSINNNEQSHHFSHNHHSTSQSHVENSYINTQSDASSYRDSISKNYSFHVTNKIIPEITSQDSISYHLPHEKNEIVLETTSHDSISHHDMNRIIPVTPTSHPSQRTPALTVECEATSTVSTEITSLHSTHNDDAAISNNSGLAGAFAQFTLGVKRSPSQDALENHLRRQGWEVGNIDYMGRDSFDNIWSKICETLASAPPQQPAQPKSREPTPSSEPVAEKPTPSVTDTQQVPAEFEKTESVPVVEQTKESTVIKETEKIVAEESETPEDISKQEMSVETPKVEAETPEVSKSEADATKQEEPVTSSAPKVETESVTPQLQESPKPDIVQELPAPDKPPETPKLEPLLPEIPKVEETTTEPTKVSKPEESTKLEETPLQTTTESIKESKPEDLPEVPKVETVTETKPVEETPVTPKVEELPVLEEPRKLAETLAKESELKQEPLTQEELVKPEELPKPEETLKLEQVPKQEEPPKAEETPKSEEPLKPEEPQKSEEVPKTEEPSKPEESPKLEELHKEKQEESPKEDKPPKQDEPLKTEEPPKQEETLKPEEVPTAEEPSKEKETPKLEEVLKQEAVVPETKIETTTLKDVPKTEVSQESPRDVQEASPAAESAPKPSEAPPKKLAEQQEPESAKQKTEIKSSETQKKGVVETIPETKESTEEATPVEKPKPKEKKVVKKVVKKVPKAEPTPESSEPAKLSTAAAKLTESETPAATAAEGSSDATPTPPPRKTTVVKKVKPKK